MIFPSPAVPPSPAAANAGPLPSPAAPHHLPTSFISPCASPAGRANTLTTIERGGPRKRVFSLWNRE